MKKVIEFFKNRIVISVIGLIVLSLLVWFVGPHIKFGSDNVAPLAGEITRLVVIMVIVVLWGLNNLRISLQNAKSNQALVEDLQSNQSSPNSVLADQRSEEIQVLNERFTQALATLQKLKFRGRGSRKALYELPWYIIIGPPGSGKTTALINSSLEFPLAAKFGKEALHGVGGTRNCDWWFTNEAVLIDTAGRYTTQDSHKVIDSSAWDGFLNLLKRHRRRRPINGAIVAISLQELLTQTADERAAHAKTIRARIDELMEKLEIRFPIYLVFTKCDLVAGFSEFFEDLNKDQREQVWGISLPNAPHPSQSPDFDFLHDRYTDLVGRLYERVLARIHQERDINRRGAIHGFPAQMENLKDIALQFVQQTFAKNRYQYQPYLRGVYFTSGTQDGTPIDRLISSVSASFGFSRDAIQPRTGMGKSFFLGQLFRYVIFPESELVGSNRRYELLFRWSQRAAYVGFAAFAVVLLVVWTGSFARNEAYLSEVKTYVSEFHNESRRFMSVSDDLRATLPMLNTLAKASAVYDKESHPWLSGLGMYDGRVDAAADRAYQAQLERLLLPRLMKNMEGRLRQGFDGGDLYDNFVKYMMLHKTEFLDRARVEAWIGAAWDKEFHGQATVRDELKAHMSVLLASDFAPAPINAPLVASVRSTLLQMPVSQRIYSRLRSHPDYSAPVNLMNEFGESARAIFVRNEGVLQRLQLPALFTAHVYQNLDLSPRSELIAGLAREKWVFSDVENARTDFAKEDLEGIAKEVRELYLAEYKSRWENVYNALEVRSFDDLRQANEVLLAFVDPVYSPLLGVLKVGAVHTTLTSQLLTDAADTVTGTNKEGAKGKAASYLASQIRFTPVDLRFRELNLMLRDAKERPAPISATIQKIRQMQEFVNELSVAPDPGKAAFEVAKARYQGGTGNTMTALIAHAKGMPDPLSRWLQALANETWRVILNSAHGHLNQQWRTQVRDACVTTIAGRYPFHSDAAGEVAMQDFTEFFKPQGVLDRFVTEFVKPFVETSGGGLSIRGVDSRGIGLSSATLAQISRAQTIKSVFFGANPSAPTVGFLMRPHSADKTVTRFTLEMGDNRITYNHGPKFWSTLTWVGGDEKGRVRLIFEDVKDQQHSVIYEGPWAWFRLQDRSKLTTTSVPNVYLVTYSAGEGNRAGNEAARDGEKFSVRYEIKGKSVHNPLNRNLLGGFRCPEGI
ncbi:MAG: type VI secretion system membrane subunit TssM [Gammaproteobacteria bacterium]